jgi:hypothetical protein
MVREIPCCLRRWNHTHRILRDEWGTRQQNFLPWLYIFMTTGSAFFGKVSWQHGLTIFIGR